MKHFRQSEVFEALGEPMSFEDFNNKIEEMDSLDNTLEGNYMELVAILRTAPEYHSGRDANLYLKWYAENMHKISDIITPF